MQRLRLHTWLAFDRQGQCVASPLPQPLHYVSLPPYFVEKVRCVSAYLFGAQLPGPLQFPTALSVSYNPSWLCMCIAEFTA